MNENYEMILCVVNAGFSDEVMDAAREAGARGGTVMHARGTANKEAEAFFHITIQPDKDVVMLLVPASIKPVISEGRTSGVNCIRLWSRESAFEKARAIVVLPTPVGPTKKTTFGPFAAGVISRVCPNFKMIF